VAFVAGAQKLGHALLDLLYPPRCVGCGQVGALLCTTCHASVSHVLPPLCPLCGKPQERPGTCPRCVEQPLALDGIRSACLFQGALREAIHHFKFKNVRALAKPLGDLLVHAWEQIPGPVDVLVPVPLHKRRLRERGYNQSQLLARYLGEETAIPVVCEALLRVRYTVSQTRLGVHERRENVADAFVCVGDQVQGQRVLLIDDVCTTGATLGACASALKAGGAQSVWALTVARAV
jgi:competence protein ComFC